MINSKHIEVQQLADGVFAALHRDGGLAICNTCIVDLGDKTLVFDTCLTLQAAIDLNLAAEALTNKNVSLVVNSHYHIDHTWGNQAFHPDINIVSSENTYHLITTHNPDVYRRYRDSLADRKRNLDYILGSMAGESSKPDDQKLWKSYINGIYEAVPRLRIQAPNLTFNRQMAIHGTRRTVYLYTFSGGHTRSDTVLYLPEERILCTGDLVYTNIHPSLLEAQPDRLLAILDELSALNPSIVVPGHGPIDSEDPLQINKKYVEKLILIAAQKLAKGASEAQLRKTAIPRQYRDWELGSNFHTNLLHVYLSLAEKNDAKCGFSPADIPIQQSI